MIHFSKLLTQHDAVKASFQNDHRLHHEPSDRTPWTALWDAITGRNPEPKEDSAAQAALETMPVEFAALLATEMSAAAAAWVRLIECQIIGSVNAFDARDAARSAWKDFSKRAKEVEKLEHGFGWGPGEAWNIESKVQPQLAEAVTRIAEMAGRMHAALRGAAAQQVSGIVGELFSVELGNDLGRMLPVERLAFTDPLLELALFERMESRRMLQYSVRGDAPASRGPLVLVLDESGSMGPVYGSTFAPRREWSKAAALAVARIAHADKRPIVVVHYSEIREVAELDPSNATSVLRMLEHFFNGGNETPGALLEARDQVEALARRGDAGADVILVTDGVEGNEPGMIAAVDALNRIGARLWTVAIECEITPDRALRAKAAGYQHIDGRYMSKAESVSALLGGVRPSPIRKAAA